MAYTLGLLSTIPVVWRGGGYQSLDLWCRDLEVQVGQVAGLRLFCPVVGQAPPDWAALAPLPGGVEVVDRDVVQGGGIRQALTGCQVLQVPGNQGWLDGRSARRVLRWARRLGIRSLVGISSDRARTVVQNARRSGAVGRLKARLKSLSIRLALRHLTAHADGTFVVGEGLRHLVSRRCRSLHVGTASWIREGDLAAAPEGGLGPARLDQLCIASRLEPMKGVHLGVEALARLAGRRPPGGGPWLTILGAGPEREALEAQVEAAGLARRVTFAGTRAYPGPFFEALRPMGLVLLTNLGEEQPRLVFDAISQGCLPVCPDSPAYAALGLPPEVTYRRGDAGALAEAVERLQRLPDPGRLWRQLLRVARPYTLEAMHRARAQWVEAEVLGAPPGDQAAASSRAR